MWSTTGGSSLSSGSFDLHNLHGRENDRLLYNRDIFRSLDNRNEPVTMCVLARKIVLGFPRQCAPAYEHDLFCSQLSFRSQLFHSIFNLRKT